MTATGWTGGEPEGGRLALAGYAGFMASVQADPDAGRTMAEVLNAPAHRSWWDHDTEAPDPDETAAGLLARGYQPGQASQLAQRLADCEADLAGEREKIEAGQRRAAQVSRMHRDGQIAAWDIPAALGDEGDTHRVAVLERRAASLRRQLAEAQAMVAAPQQRKADPVAEAGRRAHQTFMEVTRERIAAAAKAPRQRARHPFVSRGAAAGGEPDCAECRAVGATVDQSFLIHSDPQPVPVPVGWTPADEVTAERNRPVSREITRVVTAQGA